MSGVTGRQVALAFAKFGTNSWGVAASVTKGAYFSSDGGLKLDPNIIEDDAFGQVFIKTSDVGNIQAPNLKLQQQSRYDDFGYILDACAMGSPAAVVISTSAAGQSTSWTHQFDLAQTLDGLGITLAMDKQVYVEELTSAKVHGFMVEDANGGLMHTTYQLTGSKSKNDSSINTNSTVWGATFPALSNRMLKKHGVFRMNANTGGALGSTDVVTAESIKFTYNRPQDESFPYGQDYIMEPADNGFPEISLEIDYPRMNTVSGNSLFAGLALGTAWKADWTFLGNYINSTDQYKALFQFPYLQVVEHQAPTAGAKQIKPKVKLKARLATTSPTGMAFVNPFRLTRVMTQSVVAF